MPRRINLPVCNPVRTERLRALLATDMTQREIARVEGIAPSTLSEVIRRHKLRPRPLGMPPRRRA